MNARELVTRLDKAVETLIAAKSIEGPYAMKVNGIDKIITREAFLEFYIDVMIEELWDLKETLEEMVEVP